MIGLRTNQPNLIKAKCNQIDKHDDDTVKEKKEERIVNEEEEIFERRSSITETVSGETMRKAPDQVFTVGDCTMKESSSKCSGTKKTLLSSTKKKIKSNRLADITSMIRQSSNSTKRT